MKRSLTSLLALCLALTLWTPAALAAGDTPEEEAAQVLYELGLFRGTGFNKDGEPEFELGRPATRTEALVMLIRLLGKEQEALSQGGRHPFTDVPVWADSYVGYAYEKGLTNGMDATTFGAQTQATANMYLTFVLRALGYDDKAPDAPYSYSTAADFALELGLTDQTYDSFLRGDAAQVSLQALGLPQNGSDETLIGSLVRRGAVGLGSARDHGFDVDKSLVEGESVSVPILEYYDDPYSAQYTITREALRTAFPMAYAITGPYACTNSYAVEHVSLLKEHPQLYASLVIPHSYQVIDSLDYFQLAAYRDNEYKPEPDPLLIQYVLDKDLNAIGVYTPGLRSEGEQSAARFSRAYIETQATADRLKALVNDHRETWKTGTVRVDWEDPQGAWNDGGGAAHTYPIYLNGKELTDQYYVWSFSYDKVNSIESLEDFLWRAQAEFLLKPGTVTLDDGTVYHQVLSQAGQYVYDRNGILHPGTRFYERTVNDSSQLLFILVYDKTGTLMGYDTLHD